MGSTRLMSGTSSAGSEDDTVKDVKWLHWKGGKPYSGAGITTLYSIFKPEYMCLQIHFDYYCFKMILPPPPNGANRRSCCCRHYGTT